MSWSPARCHRRLIHRRCRCRRRTKLQHRDQAGDARKLEVEIEHRVRQENLKWLQKQLDQYNENAAHYEAVMKSRKGGVLTSAEFKLVWSCLHTDSRKSVSDERLNKAFNLFSKLEKLILSEAEKPDRRVRVLPKTATDLMRQNAEYQAQRAAERAAKKGTTSNVDRR